MYRIMIHEPGLPIRDCGEGPFDTYKDALTFAGTEVGLPWTISKDEDMDAMTAYQAIQDALELLASKGYVPGGDIVDNLTAAGEYIRKLS